MYQIIKNRKENMLIELVVVVVVVVLVVIAVTGN
jgi:hypothetical protein